MGIERQQLQVAVLSAGLELLLPAMYSSLEQLQPRTSCIHLAVLLFLSDD
jgi:hypothetical protein